LAAGISDEFKVGIGLRHPVAQFFNRAQYRWAVQATLLTSAVDNVLPMAGAFCRCLSGNVSVVRIQGLDLADAQFSGHLHGGIHCLAFSDTQAQLDKDWRASVNGCQAAELDGHLRFAKRDNSPLIFAALSVKEHNRSIEAEAQDVLQVVAGVAVEFDAKPCAKFLLNKHS